MAHAKFTPANFTDFLQSFRIRKEINLDEFRKNFFLTFHAFAPPIPKYSQIGTGSAYEFRSQEIYRYSFFYPNHAIQESLRHDYSALEGAIGTFINGIKDSIHSAAVGAKVIGNIKNSGSGGILQSEPKFYKRTENREISFILPLFAISRETLVDDVYLPIWFFKYFSSPSRGKQNIAEFIDKVEAKLKKAVSQYVGGSTQEAANNAINTGADILGNLVTEITLPHTFKISGGVFNNKVINPNSHWSLTGMDVSYNEEVKFLNEDGLPLQAVITVSFQELEMLFAEDWGSGPAVNITESRGNQRKTAAATNAAKGKS